MTRSVVLIADAIPLPRRPGTPCRRPGCGLTARRRGLCDTDAIAAARLVYRGETTWAALEAAGITTPVAGRQGQGGGKQSQCAAWIRRVLEGCQ